MASAPQYSPRSSRPRSVTFVVAGVFLLGLVNIYRAVGLVQQNELQLELGVVPDPRLRLILAIIWATVFLIMTTALLFRKPITRALVPVLLALYALYRLALVGLFAQSTYSRGNLFLFALIYTVVILYTIWALNRKTGASYLGVERRS